MQINKKVTRKSAIKASNSRVNRRRVIRANDEEIEEEDIDVAEGGVDVAPEASDMLFEAEDVAELIAEVTGKDVAVTAEEDVVTFEVGDDQYTVEAEGDEEILESTKRPLRNKKAVKASTLRTRKPMARRRTSARR